MRLLYKKICFGISLEKQVRFSTPVPFLFRSILGHQLRKMCCIAHNMVCPECMFSSSCIYGATFESIVPKDNTALTGRDRISHPIIIDTEQFVGDETDSLRVNLIFMGPAVSHIPYFYYALQKAGEAGILKERTPFKITDVWEEGGETSLIREDGRIETRLKPETWEAGFTEEEAEGTLTLAVETPLRFKSRGAYIQQLTGADFAYGLNRRLQVLCSQYGLNDFAGVYRFSEGWAVTEQDVIWRDFVHYSARQKKAIQLGGIMGTCVLSGTFSGYEYGLLRFAEFFHAGKNTNFGLGKIRITASALLTKKTN